MKTFFYYNVILFETIGEVILVNIQDESGWWQGENAQGIVGWFPAVFCDTAYVAIFQFYFCHF